MPANEEDGEGGEEDRGSVAIEQALKDGVDGHDDLLLQDEAGVAIVLVVPSITQIC